MGEAASKRRKADYLMLAQVIAIGVSAGFSGKNDPIQGLARALGLPYPSASGAADLDLRDTVNAVQNGARGVSNGDNGRRTRGRAGR